MKRRGFRKQAPGPRVVQAEVMRACAVVGGCREEGGVNCSLGSAAPELHLQDTRKCLGLQR